MTDTDRLKEAIKKKGLKINYIARQLGLTPYGLYLKINNKNDFKTREVSIFCLILGITSLDEKEKIFFSQKEDCKSTKSIE